MRQRLTILALLTSLLQGVSGLNAEPSAPAAVPAPAQIEALIDQLAARMPEPTRGSRDLGHHEERIWKVVDALTQLGTSAFPQLIAHFDDPRFCCTEDAMASDDVYHRSVGYACRRILISQVHRQAAWPGPDPRSSPGYGRGIVPLKKTDAEAWWQLQCDKTLRELQAENARFVVAALKERLKEDLVPARRNLHEEGIRRNEQLVADLEKRPSAMPTNPFRPYIGR